MSRPLARWACVAGVLCARIAAAEVTRVDVTTRADIGMSGYEKLAGTAHFALDPSDSHNRLIVNLDKAPRNAAGLVEFSADMYLVRPKDPERSNGSALVEVSNRGSRSLIQTFNRGGPNPDPSSDGDLGDKFLMRFGFTLAWVGWELDVDPTEESALKIRVPEASDRGRPVRLGGVGLAAVRDFASWLKSKPAAESGRVLREFLYEGFNADERDRQVFDGVMAHGAGAARTDLNGLSAPPGSSGVRSVAAFPFAEAATRDPVSGAEEGLLDNPRARRHQPKVFYTNTPVEYWGAGRVAALVHATPDGSADLKLPDNVRVYFLAGTQDSPSRFPPTAASGGEQLDNPVEHAWTLRALLLAMHRWVSTGTAPPASAHPMLADGTLVKASAIRFPAIPNVASPAALSAGAPLPLLVPAVDQDGNERAGIRLPDVAIPLATYTGWNFRAPTTGATRELVELIGASIPFPATHAARDASKDPRRSIEERYPSRDDYLAQVEKTADTLVLRGFLLIDDVPRLVQRATDTWDIIVGNGR
jgi:alpha/beta hydrolase family protein